MSTSMRGPAIVYAVNRTTQPLDCMDDGVPIVVRPGYKKVPRLDDAGKQVFEQRKGADGKFEKVPVVDIVGAGPKGDVLTEPLPYYTAERCRRQHPVMGTENPYGVNDADFLIAVPAWGQDYSYREQSDAVECIDRSLLPEDAQKATLVQVRGGRRAPVGKSGAVRTAEYIDPRLTNPVGEIARPA